MSTLTKKIISNKHLKDLTIKMYSMIIVMALLLLYIDGYPHGGYNPHGGGYYPYGGSYGYGTCKYY